MKKTFLLKILPFFFFVSSVWATTEVKKNLSETCYEIALVYKENPEIIYDVVYLSSSYDLNELRKYRDDYGFHFFKIFIKTTDDDKPEKEINLEEIENKITLKEYIEEKSLEIDKAIIITDEKTLFLKLNKYQIDRGIYSIYNELEEKSKHLFEKGYNKALEEATNKQLKNNPAFKKIKEDLKKALINTSSTLKDNTQLQKKYNKIAQDQIITCLDATDKAFQKAQNTIWWLKFVVGVLCLILAIGGYQYVTITLSYSEAFIDEFDKGDGLFDDEDE